MAYPKAVLSCYGDFYQVHLTLKLMGYCFLASYICHLHKTLCLHFNAKSKQKGSKIGESESKMSSIKIEQFGQALYSCRLIEG